MTIIAIVNPPEISATQNFLRGIFGSLTPEGFFCPDPLLMQIPLISGLQGTDQQDDNSDKHGLMTVDVPDHLLEAVRATLLTALLARWNGLYEESFRGAPPALESQLRAEMRMVNRVPAEFLDRTAATPQMLHFSGAVINVPLSDIDVRAVEGEMLPIRADTLAKHAALVPLEFLAPDGPDTLFIPSDVRDEHDGCGYLKGQVAVVCAVRVQPEHAMEFAGLISKLPAKGMSEAVGLRELLMHSVSCKFFGADALSCDWFELERGVFTHFVGQSQPTPNNHRNARGAPANSGYAQPLRLGGDDDMLGRLDVTGGAGTPVRCDSSDTQPIQGSDDIQEQAGSQALPAVGVITDSYQVDFVSAVVDAATAGVTADAGGALVPTDELVELVVLVDDTTPTLKGVYGTRSDGGRFLPDEAFNAPSLTALLGGSPILPRACTLLVPAQLVDAVKATLCSGIERRWSEMFSAALARIPTGIARVALQNQSNRAMEQLRAARGSMTEQSVSLAGTVKNAHTSFYTDNDFGGENDSDFIADGWQSLDAASLAPSVRDWIVKPESGPTGIEPNELFEVCFDQSMALNAQQYISGTVGCQATVCASAEQAPDLIRYTNILDDEVRELLLAPQDMYVANGQFRLHASPEIQPTLVPTLAMTVPALSQVTLQADDSVDSSEDAGVPMPAVG